MAVDLRDKGTVGCAYYVAQDEKLYFMEDVKFGGPEILETCNVPRSVGEDRLLTTSSEALH